MTKPYKVRDEHGLRDHTGKFSLSDKPAPGKLPEHMPKDADDEAPTPGIERDDPASGGDAPMAPPPQPEARPDKKPYRFGG